MARTPENTLSLLLLSNLILGALSFSCPSRCEVELIWTLYLRQIGAGATLNQALVVPPLNNATAFCQINVNDWDVLDAPVPGANRVARAKGTHTKAGQATGDWFTSLSIVFEGARFNGSTFQVMGITETDGQWAIIGGTGELARADGTIKHNIIRTTNTENYRQLDIHAFYTPPTVNGNTIANE